MNLFRAGDGLRRAAVPHPWRRCLRFALFVSCIGMVALPAPAAEILSGRLIANGGTSASGAGETTLSGSIGEPVAGRISAGDVRIDGGFWQPAAVARPDSIFNDGFED